MTTETAIPTESIRLKWDQIDRLLRCPWHYQKQSPERCVFPQRELTQSEWVDIIDLLVSETAWEPFEEPEMIQWSNEGKAICTDAKPCPICTGSGWMNVNNRGRVTGIIAESISTPCWCGAWKSFWEVWSNPLLVPSRFRDVTLENLNPSAASTLSLERQGEIIRGLRNAPKDSYFLSGPPGTGKTHCATALYWFCVASWAHVQVRLRVKSQTVWRVRTATLLAEHVAWETRDLSESAAVASRTYDEYGNLPAQVKPPSVTIDAIWEAVAAGLRPVLILDEIDKITPTAFKLMRLVEIVDAVYEAEGQIIATSNKSLESLLEKWGADEGGTILRRIGIGPNAHTVDFS